MSAPGYLVAIWSWLLTSGVRGYPQCERHRPPQLGCSHEHLLADGETEMIRQLKIAHDQAVEQRTTAMVTIKAMLIHAPDAMRYETAGKHRSPWPGTWPTCVPAAWKNPMTHCATSYERSPSGGSTSTPRPKS